MSRTHKETEEFALPDVGEGLTEADIAEWKVAVGETVTVNQVLVEIETAKSLVELPSPRDGVIAALLAEEGQTVEVGSPIVRFAADGNDDDDDAAPVEQSGPDSEATGASGEEDGPDPAGGNTLVGYGASTERRRARRRRPRAERSSAEPEPVTPKKAQRTVLAAPPVRKLAKELKVDLSAVPATGSRGNVTRQDLLDFHENSGTDTQKSATALSQAPAEQRRIPVSGVRKATAAAMVSSAFTAPHVTCFLDVDVTDTLSFLDELKQAPELTGVKVTPMLLLARAVCWAVGRNPMVNGRFTAEEIIVSDEVNLGIAAATERGLIVPNIKGAQQMSLGQLGQALAGLTDRARAGKTSPAEMRGGTVTITNVGVFGVDSGTPILNPGESAILALGRIRRIPWEHEDQIALRHVTTLAVSADHRILDGKEIALFLSDVGRALSDPKVMLL